MSKQRIKALQGLLKSYSCDAFLVEDKNDLYYLTGLELSAGKLLIYSSGAFLIVDGRYYEACRKTAPCSVLLAEQNSLEKILSQPDLHEIQIVGFDQEHTSYARFLELQKCLQESQLNLLPLHDLVMELRRIKDDEEILLLKETGILGGKGFDFVCSILKEGITESEVALELEIFWKRLGAKGVAFDPIIAFGVNSSMPHYRAGQAKLQKNDLVLIDIGVTYRHYHSDMTRVLFVGDSHQIDPEMKRIYSIVKEAQAQALLRCKPGTSIGELDQSARGYIADQGYGDKFTHSLGHGIGLDVHEFPFIRNREPFKDVILKPGMVITIEPGIYLPGKGGVRLEDTVVITEEGYQNLTNKTL
jgi:Xaa-Pro aminopeptidase